MEILVKKLIKTKNYDYLEPFKEYLEKYDIYGINFKTKTILSKDGYDKILNNDYNICVKDKNFIKDIILDTDSINIKISKVLNNANTYMIRKCYSNSRYLNFEYRKKTRKSLLYFKKNVCKGIVTRIKYNENILNCVIRAISSNKNNGKLAYIYCVFENDNIRRVNNWLRFPNNSKIYYAQCKKIVIEPLKWNII